MTGKIYCILSLLLVTVLAEKKINLEDIERDNLRSEIKSSSNNVRDNEASYAATAKPESTRQEYQPEYIRPGGSSGGYASQELGEKYAVPSEDYQQDVKYLENDVGYQQTGQPVQQYVDYQPHQQVETSAPKGLASTYEAPQQQLVYQQEVPVGNQYQSVQQKAASEKYLKSSNKDAVYVNIPMEYFLSYYPNLAFGRASLTKSSARPLVHGPVNQGAQQIAIPVYTPPQRGEPIYAPSKLEYQIQPQSYLSYALKYPQQTEAILPTKQPKKLIYSQSVLSHRQPQLFMQEIVYSQPSALYSPSTSSSHVEVYARPSVNLRGNSLSHGYASQSNHQLYTPTYNLPERYYAVQSAAPPAAPAAHQAYQHQSPDEQDNYEVPESPSDEYDLPRLPAQDFKSGSGVRLSHVNSESDDSHYTQNHLGYASGHKSLLDSYVPSGIIAAQDSERYRERPIKLERGFLPSKINFVQSYKKRKAE